MSAARAVAIAARHPRYDFSKTPLQWLPGEPETQTVIDVLHLLLPAGERWFCRVFAQTLPRIRDSILREECEGFIRQEGWHARTHADVLEHFAARGIDPAAFTRDLDGLFDIVLADKPFGAELPAALQPRWLEFRVALIAAIEHFTSVLGTWILEATQLDAAHADPTMLDLLRWHGAEEVEHRAVAFDVSRALGVGWAQRQLAMALVVPMFWVVWVQGVRFLTRRAEKAEPAKFARPSWRKFVRAGRRGLVPTIGHLLGSVLRYPHPLYHPRREGATARAFAFFAKSPSVRAVA